MPFETQHRIMRSTFRSLLITCICILPTCLSLAAAPRALPAGQLPKDQRLKPLEDLDGHFPFEPAASQQQWQRRAEQVRQRVLVSMGLWPMPERTPPEAVVHGLVDRPEYTVEKVYLQSYPGHFVTGNLYRPKGGAAGRLPAVLCPHGHWSDGRFHDAGRDNVRRQIVQGAERFEVGGRSPLQSRCVQLARMGCIVFHYDMVGYADSVQIPYEVAHRYAKRRPHMDTAEDWGFFGAQAELRLQSIMGLQTYNSIRALDWLCERPDVDPNRIAVTGASGGGTQTFILSAIDPRPAVSFPAVMVSTAMQGGCTCENATYLRIGTGNVELAALFAPKPLGLTAADDWTREIATKGAPQLRQHFAMLGAEENFMAAPLLHFGHNYNYVSRAVMYGWLNKHLKLGFEDPIVEEDYVPLTRDELSVWNDEHPRPDGGEDYERELIREMTESSDAQIAALRPTDEASLKRYREVIGGAVDVMIGRDLPDPADLEYERTGKTDRGDYLEMTALLRNTAHGEELPTLFLFPKQWNRQVVVWVHEEGKAGLLATDGSPRAAVRKLLDGGAAVAGVDLLYQGEFLADGMPPAVTRKVENEREFAGYTFGYNDPLFVRRVHDVLTMLSFVKHHEDQPERIDLVGMDGAGPWVALAAAHAGEVVDRAVVDTAGFRFTQLESFRDPQFLPGAAKYGDLPGILALRAPRPLWLAGEGDHVAAVVNAAYQAAGASDALSVYDGDEARKTESAVHWLLH